MRIWYDNKIKRKLYHKSSLLLLWQNNGGKNAAKLLRCAEPELSAKNLR